MASSRRQYPFHLIEPKWQQTWEQQQAFRAFNPNEEIPADIDEMKVKLLQRRRAEF